GGAETSDAGPADRDVPASSVRTGRQTQLFESKSNDESRILVQHHVVKQADSLGLYISLDLFDSLQAMIEHYENTTTTELGCQLKAPCPREYVRPLQLSDYEIILESEFRKLSGTSFGDISRRSGDDKQQQTVVQEAEVMRALNHSKIVQLLGVCTAAPRPFIVTELLSNVGTANSLPTKRCSICCSRLLRAWSILKRNDSFTLICALTTSSWDLRNSVKIGNFRLSRFLEEDECELTRDAKFPIRWTAPEVFAYQTDKKSDVWSFGVLAYEVVTRGGGIPYFTHGYRMRNPHDELNGIDSLYDIMLACWNWTRLTGRASPV
uniref:Protein kinase domain-containing protein n=1 Tax=Macrostomum lignano TaxID=282301 RepID=A0A1I8FII3_9PLAT